MLFKVRDVEDYEGEVLEELVVDLVVMLVVLALQFVSEEDIERNGAVMQEGFEFGKGKLDEVGIDSEDAQDLFHQCCYYYKRKYQY